MPRVNTTVSCSLLKSGGTLVDLAHGAGQDSTISGKGAQFVAGKDLTLQAEGDINLLAAKSTSSEHTTSSSNSGGVGVAFGMEQGKGAFAGFNANASMSRGHVDGNGSQYQLSELNAGGRLNLVSGGNVTLQGIAKGQQVAGDIAGDLKLDSLQDTSTYHSQNQTLSAEGTYGAGFSGSISYSQQKMDADYASVQRQSGIQAGDGGFQVKVGGTTTLNGAEIASSDKAVADGKNSLQTGALVLKDIGNHTDYSASSTSVSVGTGGPGGGLPMQASGHDSTTTRAGISGGSLTITNNALQEAQTGQTASQAAAGANRAVSSDKDGSGKLANNFDANQVQGLFDAANALNQQVGTFISNKMQAAKEAKEALKRAEDNGLSKDSDEYHKLQREAIDTEEDAAKWAPGSRRGQVITAVMAGITGNLGNSLAGMAQNGGIAYLQGMGAQEVKAYLQDLSNLGLSKEKTEALRTIMQSAVGCAGAAASGQSCGAGAAGGAGAVVLNNALNVLQGMKPEDMNAEQKADRENLVNTLVTGVALGTGGASTAATTVNAAKTEMENNAFADWQIPVRGDKGIQKVVKDAEKKGSAFALKTLADQLPIVGTALSLRDAKDATDVMLSLVSGLPDAGLLVSLAKEAKAAVAMGDLAAANKYLSEAKTEIVSFCTNGACFVAGTPILTDKGLKPVETFVGGELVWSRSDETGEFGFRPVVAHKATADQDIFRVVVEDATGKQEVLRTTAEHPFWIKDWGWRTAALLQPGMTLLDKADGLLTVISQEKEDVRETVFNIQVAEFQTYHVGELGVWVHNAKCCPELNGSQSPVKELEVGSYKDLKSRSVVGDGLEHDHIPSFAALKTAREKELGRPLSRSELRELYNNATAVEIPKDVHREGRTYGGKNTPEQVGEDARNLCNAVSCDTMELRSNLLKRGYDPIKVDETIRAIVKRNKEMGVVK
ncbi:hemagglutinin repeat-containing protein [Chromobacterium violaceum]|uniref:hemagglutinin repeat-containing protein n=1 Tax=Chromobacterium violaceum TaxID=536 RepID=UPI00385E8A70